MIETVSPFLSKLNKCAGADCTTIAAIEVTNRCNARCGYCFLDKSSSFHELSTTQLHQIITKLEKESILIVNITGGEPFLRDDISEILEHLFKSTFFYVSIYSNGTILKEEHFSLLEKYHDKIYPFRMTVFSHDAATHDSYMKIPGSLQTILDNGMRLLQCGIKVQLAIPVLFENYKTIAESIKYFNELGFPTGINLVKLITNTNHSKAIDDMTSEDFYYELITSLNHNGLTINFSPLQNKEQLCRGIKTSIMIDTNGDIHPCTAFRNFIIGSIFDPMPLNDLLKKNEDYNKLRSLSKNHLVCSKCDHHDECSPCLARHHSLTLTTEGPYPLSCNLTKAIYKFKNPIII